MFLQPLDHCMVAVLPEGIPFLHTFCGSGAVRGAPGLRGGGWIKRSRRQGRGPDFTPQGEGEGTPGSRCSSRQGMKTGTQVAFSRQKIRTFSIGLGFLGQQADQQFMKSDYGLEDLPSLPSCLRHVRAGPLPHTGSVSNFEKTELQKESLFCLHSSNLCRLLAGDPVRMRPKAH